MCTYGHLRDENIFPAYDKNKEKHMHAYFYSIVISNRKFIALKQEWRQKRSTVMYLFCSKKMCTCEGNLDTAQTLKSNCSLQICYSSFVFSLNLRPILKRSKLYQRHCEINDKFRLQTIEQPMKMNESLWI